ncbi:MAG: cell division protein FtsZ [Patiriisocius sp.]|jgi:cell division protein FtsZ
MSLDFDLPKDKSNILKVIGVGGGGSNAVNHMYLQGIKDVDFIVCNTDQQALDTSPVPVKVQLGANLTEGRGAGSIPEVGRNAAIESLEEIREILSSNTTMVFITAGMGGGTGTGAAPVIAKMAKEMGILTVGIVTIPFGFEGPRRKKLAEEGLGNLRNCVDTLLVIKNDKLREVCGNLSVTSAFHESDNILTTAAKGIADVISAIGYINVDMNDVNTVMKDSGVAIMGSAKAEGDDRAQKAVREALESPLLNDNEIKGAQHVLLNITFGDQDVTMDELDEITRFIQDEAGDQAEVIMGYGQDDTLGESLNVTVIATDFRSNLPNTAYEDEQPVEKKYHDLDAKPQNNMMSGAVEIDRPIDTPVETTMEESSFDEPFLVAPEDKQEEIEVEVNPMKFEDLVEDKVMDDIQVEETLVDQPLSNDLGFTPDIMKIDMETEDEAEVRHEIEEERTYFNLTEDDGVEEKEYDLTNQVEFETDKIAKKKTAPVISPEEHQRRNRERMAKIKDLSIKLKTPNGVAELENEPAFKRQNVQLDATPHSSDSDLSRYNLSEGTEDGETKLTLRKDNPFFTDNVD